MSEIDRLREHLDELRGRVLRSVIVVVAIAACLMTFHAEEARIGEYTVYYPTPGPFENIAAQITDYMRADLVPDGVELIQTAPGQAFFAQVHVAALAGIIVGVPVIVREAVMFLRPALKERELHAGRAIFAPAIALFVSGCVFSYLLVIPYTLDFLYRYGESAGLVTFLNISDFVGMIMQFLLAFGVSFQIPLFMYALSAAGMADSGYWLRNARYAIVIMVVFGAIITPDGSGITMWFIALPMTALYFVGVAAIRRSERGAGPAT